MSKAGVRARVCAGAMVLALLASTAPDVAHAQSPVHLAQRWALDTPGVLPQAVALDPRDPTVLYAALKTGGVSVLFPGEGPSAPGTLATVSTAALGNLDAMNLAISGSYLYVALGDFFAASGAKAGLAIVDITDPRAPQVVGLWVSPTVGKGAAAVAVDGRYAYLGAMSEGIKILDISDPSSIRLVTAFLPDPQFPRRNPTAAQYPNARGLALSGSRLFVADDAGGLRVIDVTVPTAPRELSRYINSRMSGKQQAYNNLVLDGSRVYVAVDYGGLEILDISNILSIRQLGWWNPWHAESFSNIWFNSAGHTNQIAYDPARRLIYLSAGDSELQVVDVSNPFQPRLAADFGAPKNNRGTWGMTLGDTGVYLMYMQAVVPFVGNWSGIVLVDRVR